MGPAITQLFNYGVLGIAVVALGIYIMWLHKKQAKDIKEQREVYLKDIKEQREQYSKDIKEQRDQHIEVRKEERERLLSAMSQERQEDREDRRSLTNAVERNTNVISSLQIILQSLGQNSGK
jgi:hypothetical protein